MRLVRFIIIKQHNFEKAYKNNYARAKRVIVKTFRENMELIKVQREFYNTDAETCECGETKLISKMMRLNIPCSHIYSITGKFPEIADLHLILTRKKAS